MKEELKQKCTERARIFQQAMESCHSSNPFDCIEWFADRITELEVQIKKMKCCENCGWYYLQQHWRESKEINESRMFHCGTCGNKRNWKLREVKND